MAKSKSSIKLFRREYIPLVIACSVLVLLVVALVITIINKPKKTEPDNPAQSSYVQEKVVPNNSCGGDDYTKLVEEANKITASYKVNDQYDFGCGFSTEEEIPDNYSDDECPEDQHVLGYALDVILENIPQNVDVIVTNDLDGKKLLFNNSDGENDVVVWTQPETSFLRVYNFKVYSKIDGCQDKLIREFEITLPRWNEMSKVGYCEHEEYKNSSMCERFIFEAYDINKDLTSHDKEIKKIYNEKKQQEEKEEKENKFAKYSKYIIIAIVVVAVVIVGIVFILMKGRKKNEKK